MTEWKCPDCGSVGTPYVAELDALRARVTEAERLLRELRMPPCMDDPIEWVGVEGDWIERRDKWLSGSDAGSLK